MKAQPPILGTLYDSVAASLANEPTTVLDGTCGAPTPANGPTLRGLRMSASGGGAEGSGEEGPSGEPFDTASGYALHDERVRPVEAADGCVCSVIGPPLWTVRRLLRVAGGVETLPPAFFHRCAGCPLAEAR